MDEVLYPGTRDICNNGSNDDGEDDEEDEGTNQGGRKRPAESCPSEQAVSSGWADTGLGGRNRAPGPTAAPAPKQAPGL